MGIAILVGARVIRLDRCMHVYACIKVTLYTVILLLTIIIVIHVHIYAGQPQVSEFPANAKVIQLCMRVILL